MNIIFLAAAFIIGNLSGVFLMCLLQISRYNTYCKDQEHWEDKQ